MSKSIVDGSIKGAGKYSTAQRARLHRMGVHRFFRLPSGVEALGDNGAFNYVDEVVPPVTPAKTLDFYEECGFDAGVSTDHVVFGYEAGGSAANVDPNWEERRKLTLRLAEEFLALSRERASRVDPVGAAQGWSPESVCRQRALIARPRLPADRTWWHGPAEDSPDPRLPHRDR